MSGNDRVFEDPRHLRSVDALDIQLTAEAVPEDQLVDGSPTTSAEHLGEIFGIEFGLWEMSGGVMSDIEAEELFIVLAGKATVKVEAVNGFKAEEFCLVPGSICHLREGMHTIWDVTEPLRKVYLAK